MAYSIGFDSYIESLCENKEQIEIMCNGKCFIAKQGEFLIQANTPKSEQTPALYLPLEHLNPSHIVYTQNIRADVAFIHLNLLNIYNIWEVSSPPPKS